MKINNTINEFFEIISEIDGIDINTIPAIDEAQTYANEIKKKLAEQLTSEQQELLDTLYDVCLHEMVIYKDFGISTGLYLSHCFEKMSKMSPKILIKEIYNKSKSIEEIYPISHICQ